MDDEALDKELARKYQLQYRYANAILAGAGTIWYWGVTILVLEILSVAVLTALGGILALLSGFVYVAWTAIMFYGIRLGLQALGMNLKVNVDSVVNSSPFLSEAMRKLLLLSAESGEVHE